MTHSPGFLKLVNAAKKKIKQVSIAQVLKMFKADKSFYFIDIREDHEWEKGHARGATHIGRGILERDIESIVPDKRAEIVLYCGGGFRSALSAESLKKMGFKNVRSMAGGYRAWVEAKAPLAVDQDPD